MSLRSIVRGFVASALMVGSAMVAGAASDQAASQKAATRTQQTDSQQREHLQKLQVRMQAIAAEWERTAMKRFEDDRRAFLEKNAATLQSENAKVRAQIARLRREGQ